LNIKNVCLFSSHTVVGGVVRKLPFCKNTNDGKWK